MTTKQIAEATSKPEKTVRTWVKKTGAKMATIEAKLAISSPMKPADYDIDETCSIIETGLGKNAANLYRMNARGVPAQQSSLTEKDLELIAKLTAGIVSQVMSNMESRVVKIESRIEERQALLPAPGIEPRSHVTKLVREFASRNNIDYREAWRELYKEFSYRTHSSPSISAKNRNMAVIDYIESEGQIETLLSVAMEVLK